jgi:hypothetical protein
MRTVIGALVSDCGRRHAVEMSTRTGLPMLRDGARRPSCIFSHERSSSPTKSGASDATQQREYDRQYGHAVPPSLHEVG